MEQLNVDMHCFAAESHSRRVRGRKINFGRDIISYGEQCLIPVCFAWENARPPLQNVLNVPESCWPEINSRTLCRDVNDKSPIQHYVLGTLEPQCPSGKMLFSLSFNSESGQCSRHEILIESSLFLSF